MRAILVLLLALPVTPPAALAQVFRCVDATGGVSYQDTRCGTASVAGKELAVPKAKWTVGAKLEVTPEVVRECFEGYATLSRDPTEVKYLGHTASVVPAGFPVLHVSAVLKNEFGGPDRELLWCKLTDSLQLDQAVMKEKWTSFFARQRGYAVR